MLESKNFNKNAKGYERINCNWIRFSRLVRVPVNPLTG
jgi:hypothetical protein